MASPVSSTFLGGKKNYKIHCVLYRKKASSASRTFWKCILEHWVCTWSKQNVLCPQLSANMCWDQNILELWDKLYTGRKWQEKDKHDTIINNSVPLISTNVSWLQDLLLAHNPERIKLLRRRASMRLKHVSVWHLQLWVIMLNDDVITVKEPYRVTLFAPNKEYVLT